MRILWEEGGEEGEEFDHGDTEDGQIERGKILTWSPMVCEIDKDAILGAALQRQSFQYHTQMMLCRP